MEEFQDLVILAESTGCPRQHFFFLNFDNIIYNKINLLLIPSLGQLFKPELKVTGF